MRYFVLAVVVAVSSCRELALPTNDKPGLVSATLLAPRPGRQELSPAAGATLELVGAGLRATADADGNVRLDGILRSSGTLKASFTSPESGETFERVFDVRLAGVGPGRTTSLGIVSLGRRATLVGTVLRGDVAGTSGHAGIQVFVPESPLITLTADDGFFVLSGVPAGDLTLSAFKEGYVATSSQLEVRGGEERRLDALTLAVDAVPRVGSLRGAIVDESGQPISGATATLNTGLTVPADQGAYEFGNLTSGLFSVRLRAPGRVSVSINSVFVGEGARDLGASVLVAGVDSSDGGFPVAQDGGSAVAVTRVRWSGGELFGNPDAGGLVHLPGAEALLPGDVVVLLLSRYPATSAVTPTRPEWSFIGMQRYGSGEQVTTEVAMHRVTAADVSTIYDFDAAKYAASGTYGSIGYGLLAYRNVGAIDASTLVRNGTTAFGTQGTSSIRLPAGSFARGDVMLDLMAVEFRGLCNAPASADGGLQFADERWTWWGATGALEQPAMASGEALAAVSQCPNAQGAYTVFQLRLQPR